MIVDDRIRNESEHGKLIAREGEELWNWSSPAGRLRLERRAAMFVSFIGNEEKAVLEVGCGTGLFTRILAKTNNHIISIDISSELLSIARQRVCASNVTFMEENAYATSFPDKSFDFVIGSASLHHLEIGQAIHEISRLLKPGGSFMFTEPNMLNPQIALQKNVPYFRRLAGDSPNETAFIRFLLRNKLETAGFSDVIIEPFDFIHPAIPERFLASLVPALTFMEKIPLIREIAGSLLIRGRKRGGDD